jgi:hypothetical protein
MEIVEVESSIWECEKVTYNLFLFNMILFPLPFLGRWMWQRESKYVMQNLIDCEKIRDLPSIGDQVCLCSNCGWMGTVYDCESDIDGDGSLGCPECETVIVVIAK